MPNDHTPHAGIAAFNAQSLDCGWPFTLTPAEGFAHPKLAAMAALWHEKAQGRAMPDRADLTARVMKPFLSNMSLLETVETQAGRRWRVRLHGSALARYSGDGTGKFLEEVVLAGRAGGYAALYDFVATLDRPVRVLTAYQSPEISYLTGESLVAPLARDGTPLLLSVTYPKPRAELAQAGLRIFG